VSKPGTVYLVGAGPGDPGLITVKGLRCLEQADVVVYDRLSSPDLLRHVRPDAEKVFMGKEPSTPSEFQQAINQALVDAARAGKMVVRLKGGDPFVFGRGGEELLALHEAGIPFQVVPGVTSAIAVPGYAGIPITHRGMATAFTVVSGSEDPTKPETDLDWGALAVTPGTLVVLMGWRRLAGIVATLLQHGRSPGTPVTAVQWGTTPQQRTVSGTLADILQRGDEAGLTSPVVIVIGEVGSLRNTLRWFDTGPLFGKRVLVTRSRTQASSLANLLTDQGADAVELATIEIAPLESYAELDTALDRLPDYQWLVLTSVNGVEAVFDRLQNRSMGATKVAAVGTTTTAALTERGVTVDFMPETYTSAGIAEGFSKFPMTGARVLLARADIAPDTLPKALASLGASVEEVTAYRTLLPAGADGEARRLLTSGTMDVATFTSSSSVRNLVALLDGDTSLLKGLTIASIGPVTSQTAVELGLKVDMEATEHTVPSLVRSLVDHFKTAKSGAER
jgi:uroporphyrinogen III methyltransferase/synthase